MSLHWCGVCHCQPVVVCSVVAVAGITAALYLPSTEARTSVKWHLSGPQHWRGKFKHFTMHIISITEWFWRKKIWVGARRFGCLVTWFCYQLIAKPGNKTQPNFHDLAHMHMYICIFWHSTLKWHSCLTSLWKTRTCLSYLVDTMLLNIWWLQKPGHHQHDVNMGCRVVRFNCLSTPSLCWHPG